MEWRKTTKESDDTHFACEGPSDWLGFVRVIGDPPIDRQFDWFLPDQKGNST